MTGWRDQRLRLGVAAAALFALALPPALAAVGLDRVGGNGNADTSAQMLGQFTPAAGDPRLIARFQKVPAAARQQFSFTPVVGANVPTNRAITVVVRTRAGSGSSGDAARTAALVSTGVQPVAITPIAYNLGASVGFDKFVMPKLAQGVDLRAISAPPVAAAEPDRKTGLVSRFGSRWRLDDEVRSGEVPRVSGPDAARAVEMEGSFRLTRNLDVTAGVRVNNRDRLQPLTDDRRDSQAVYVGTQFRF